MEVGMRNAEVGKLKTKGRLRLACCGMRVAGKKGNRAQGARQKAVKYRVEGSKVKGIELINIF